MKRVESMEEYREALHENKRALSFVATNSFLMPQMVRGYIGEGRFFLEKYEDGIVFYLDEERYYNLFYYWQPGKELPSFRKNFPVLVEEMSNHGSRDAYIQSFEPFLQRAGFRVFKRNLQVERAKNLGEEALSQELARRKESLEQEGYVVRDATEADFEPVRRLWEGWLDMTDVPASHMHLSDKEKLVCAFSPEGEVAAVQWWKNVPKASEGRHTVTHPAHTRKGLAHCLILDWCVDAGQNGAERAFTWITDSNIASLALYKKAGFAPNGRVSRQYLLE